jgi:hypothetical protein
MNYVPLFRRFMLLRIIIFLLVLFALMMISIHFGWLILIQDLMEIFDTDPDMMNGDAVFARLSLLKERFIMFGIPACLIIISSWGVCLWFFLAWGVSRRITPVADRSLGKGEKGPKAKKRHTQPTGEKPVRKKPVSEKIIYKTDVQKEHRLYIHLLSVFQKEGRLVDFLFENLSEYADDQIGAAVRNIHQNCKQVLLRYLTLIPVIDVEEGGRFTLKKDFDMDLFNLVGNVRGEPPFEGVVKHSGWRIKGWNLPDFSGESDSAIVQPAEVELP